MAVNKVMYDNDTLIDTSNDTALEEYVMEGFTFHSYSGEKLTGNLNVYNMVANAYDATQTYEIGDYVIYEKYLYQCSTAISSPEAWNSAHWTQVTIGEELEQANQGIANTYTKSQVDTALGNYYTKTQMDTTMANYYNKTQIDSKVTQINNNTATAYSSSSQYSVGDYCLYNGALYRCTTAIPSGEAWTAGHWTSVDIADDMRRVFDVTNDNVAELYDSTKTYALGEFCIYQDNLYRCTTAITTAEAFNALHWTQTNVGDEIVDINTALETKAEIDGYYESMTVGNAEQLVATVGVEEEDLYMFRTTGGSADVGDRVDLKKLTGGTVAWNQLMRDVNDTSQATNFSGNGGSISYSNKSIVFTPNSGTGARNFGQKSAVSTYAIVGHKYFYSCYLKISSLLSKTPVIAPKIGATITLNNFPENTDTLVHGVMNVVSAEYLRMFIYPWGTGTVTNDGTETVTVHDAMIIDLTQMFGATIADYIYGLEQNQAGDGVAFFRKHFPKTYYAYDAGSLQSVCTSGHTEVGFNQWDISTDNIGKNLDASGELHSNANFCTSDYIRVVPSVVYYFKNVARSNEARTGCFYDASKSFISDFSISGGENHMTSGTFTMPSDCHYIRVTRYSTVTEVCASLHWDGERDGEYEPFDSNSYPIDDIQLRGIPKLDVDNNLYYDGDTYEPDGTVTKRYASVDLGSLTYTATSMSNNRTAYTTPFSGLDGRPFGSNAAPSAEICPSIISTSKFTQVNQSAASWAVGSFVYVWSTGTLPGNTIGFITNTSDYADAAAFKTAMNGVYLVYKLATPTTESADPYQLTQVCNDFGTEYFTDAGVAASTRDVEIPVFAEAYYQANLRAKLEMAPNSPDGAGDYIVRQTDGTNEYIAVTSNPTISGLVSDMNDLLKYDDVCKIIKITDVSTTLGDVSTTLNAVNTAGDHIFFDMSALGVMMYLCTIFIDTTNNQYKVFDLVSGRYAEGVYDASMLLTMATAQANGLAVQSQIDYLQGEIDELGGKSVLANWDVLGDMILNGTSTDVISAEDIVDVNWIKTVLGTTTSGLTVSCTDIDKFAQGVGEAEAKDYLFVYDGSNWTYNGETITLADFGLSVTGTPISGEVMDIKTTVDTSMFTFVGYDDITPCDSNVPHNWCLEETYAPNTKAYDTYESMFCIQQGKSVPAGKYYLPMYSYRSSDKFNACFTLSASLGSNDSKVQMSRGASGSAARTDVNGTSKSDVYAVTSMSPVMYGTTTSAGSAVAVTYLSDADVTSGGYTLLTSLNVDANDPVMVVGSFDKAALGSNTWELSNIRQYCNDDSKSGSATPTHDNDILSSYNRSAGALYGIDPRVKKLIQYAEIPWLCGRDNVNTPHYAKATGTAPASDAPIYYERGGVPGNRTYTALDPQPSSGDDVSSYYIFENDYVYNKTYVSEDRCFLLSMHEMSFDLQATEGNAVDLYAEYTNNTYTNGAVAARAKYNKPGGTLNNYRWSRSATSTHASNSRVVVSSGSYSYNNACNSLYYARAFIVGKSTNQ